MSETDYTDTEEEEARTARLRQRESSLTEDWRTLLRSRGGRRIVWQILSDCGVFHSSFSNDVPAMSFNEGRRSVGLGILARVMDLDPDSFAKMQREFKADVLKEDRE